MVRIRCQLIGAVLLVAASVVAAAPTAEYELRLVPYDQPDVDVGARVAQMSAPWAAFAGGLSEAQRAGYVAPCASWARNVLLDEQPAFEIYERGQYLDRRPVCRPKLNPGQHTLWPGNHVFTVAKDGTVATADPELLIATEPVSAERVRHVVRIKCYPVTIRARYADPRAPPPASLLEEVPLPNLVIRESADNDAVLAQPAGKTLGARELLPEIRRFLWLTAWLPANTNGKGYVVHPLRHTFHVGAKGLVSGAGEGGYAVPGWQVAGYELTLPMMRVPVWGEPEMEVLVTDVQQLKFASRGANLLLYANLFKRQEPYEFRVSASGPALLVVGQLDEFANKVIRVDGRGTDRVHQRGILVELPTRHLDAGKPFPVRFQAVDPYPATKAAAELTAAEATGKAAVQALGNARNEVGRCQQELNKVQPKAAAAAQEEVRAQAEADNAQKALEAATAAKDQPKIEAATKQLAAARQKLQPATAARVQEEAAVAGDAKVQAARAALAETVKARTAAETADAEAQTKIVAARQRRDEQAAVNALADATPFASLQVLGSREWRALAVAPKAKGQLEVALPEGLVGVCRLRLGVRPTEAGQPDCVADQWVTVAAGKANGFGGFTPRGRTAFYRGESFWLGFTVLAAVAPVPAGTPLTVEVVGAAGARLNLYQGRVEREIRERDTFILNLSAATSATLAPGRYQVVGRLGAQASPPLTLELVEPAPATHFTNLLLGKYNGFGQEYSQAITGQHETPEEVPRAIAECGYNAFMGMTYVISDRVVFPDRGLIAELVRERPEVGPGEAFAVPSGRDTFLNGMVRHNLRFYENLFTQHDSIMPRGEKLLQACVRYAALETQALRHNPAFRGVCLYDELNQALDHDTSMAVLAFIRSADEAAYRSRYGHGSSTALRALDRFTGRPEGQRRYEDLCEYLTWPQHLDGQWEDFSARLGGVARFVMPDAVNFTLARQSAVPNATLSAGTGTWEGIFRPLQAAGVVGYKDMGGYGEFPVGGALGANVLRVHDGLLAWPMLNGAGTGPHGDADLRHAFFTLSQRPDGLSFMQFESPPSASPGDNFDGVKDITQTLCTRYGDLFLAAERGYRQVAIVYSRNADLLSLRKATSVSLMGECLWVACLRAGFPAQFLTESQLQAGRGSDYQVIFLPGFSFKEEVAPATLAALKRLQAANKMLVVDQHSRLDLSGLVRLDSDFGELDDRSGGLFPKHLDADDETWWDMSTQTTALLRKFLAKHVPPAAEHDCLVGPDWLRCGQGEYLVMPNLAFTGFTGNHKTLYQAPDTPTIRFPARPPVCYDVLEMQPATGLKTSADGKTMSLTLDFRHYPGKIYAFLPAAIAGVSLRAPATVPASGTLNYEVTAVDAGGQVIPAGIPLEITLSAARGAVLQHHFRAANPAYRAAYTVPVNAGPEPLRLRVRELLSGRWAEATIAVTPGTVPPAVLDARTVRVHDGERLRQFLAEQATKTPLLLTATDLVQPGALAKRLREDQDPLAQYLRGRLAPATSALLAKHQGDAAPAPELLAALVTDLNQLITGEALYTPERFPLGSQTIETGRLGQEVRTGEALADVNRLQLESHFAGELTPRLPVLIAVEEESARAPAEDLRRALQGKGVRVRVVNVQPYLYGPTEQMVAPDQTVVMDGTRLWRGEPVKPDVHVDAPLIVVGGRRGLVQRLIEQDLLPEPVSENFPGPGRAVLSWVHQGFSTGYDTVVCMATDAAGLRAGIAELVRLLAEAPAPAVPPAARVPPEAPAFEPAAALVATVGREAQPSSFRADLRYEDRIEVMDLDPGTGRLLVGTFGYGHDLFCFGPDGRLLWKQFLPQHDVYVARWCDDAKQVVAATGQGFKLFLLDGQTGAVRHQFGATEWPEFQVEERETRTHVGIVLNPPLRQILVLGRTGLLAVGYDGRKQWFYDRAPEIVKYPAAAVQTGFASFGQYVRSSAVAPGPDGSRLVYNEQRYFATYMAMGGPTPLWRNEPQILDARTGAVLLRNETDPGSNDEWHVTWPAGAATPWIHAPNLSAPLEFTGQPRPGGGPDPGRLGTFVPPPEPPLPIGGVLRKDYHSSRRVAANGQVQWENTDEVFWVVAFDRVNTAGTRLYRCSREGLLRCLDLNTGKTAWEQQLPVVARLLLMADDGLIAGARNGLLTRFDAAGKVVWQTQLRQHHEVPAADYAKYVADAERAVPDESASFYPVFRDAPDDYRDILRLGLEQLEDGGFETGTAWAAATGAVALIDAAKAGKKSLFLNDGQLVTSTIARRIVTSATYLLEFWYQPATAGVTLAAGARLAGPEPILTVANFAGRPGEWAFGRVAIKTMADTTGLDVGFEARGGRVYVDGASLRAIRFPSANLLANADVHAVPPTHPVDFRLHYSRLSAQLHERLLGVNNVSAFLQAVPLGALIFTEEPAFLQNGRLDDVGPMWCYRPDPIGFAVVLMKPTYVSHLVLYFNNTTPQTVYRNVAIIANDLDKKLPETVALIRGNERRFVVVHFPKTIYTDSLKILPGHYRTRHDCLTEVEVYGPIGGPATLQQKVFDPDPLATPMFMGRATHVPTALPEDLLGKYQQTRVQGFGFAPSLHANPTAVKGIMSFAQGTGTVEQVPIGAEGLAAWQQAEAAARQRGGGQPFLGWRLGTIGPLTTPARYAGRLLIGAADYQLHAIADNGTPVWAFTTGGRIYSSPAPDRDEVYFGSDDGFLYKVDVDSGILLWQFKTGGRVRGAPALDGQRAYCTSWDGFVYAVDQERGTLAWKAPVAAGSSSSPAVANGRVYVGDEDGKLHALDAASGKEAWACELGGPDVRGISMGPVVTPEGVFVATDGGTGALVDGNGKALWQRDLYQDRRAGSPVPPRVTGQPLATRSQVVVPGNRGLLVLSRQNGQPDGRFIPPGDPGNVVGVCVYGRSLGLIVNGTGLQGDWTRFIVAHGAAALVWEPENAGGK